MDDQALAGPDHIESWLRSRSEPVLLIDAGGVIFNNVIESSPFMLELAVRYRVDVQALRAAYTARDVSFETNLVGVHRVLSDCLEGLGCGPLDPPAFAWIDDQYRASVIPDRGLLAALRSARAAGKTLVLANNEAEAWDRIKDRAFGHFDLFDHLACSWRLGACKPTPAYFEQLDRLLYPQPRFNWHLLDDNPAVVAQAHAMGVGATRYQSRPGPVRPQSPGDCEARSYG